MSRHDRKQRHEAKRKEKRLAARRRDAVSPVKRLAAAPGELECWLSDDFEAMGQIQLFVYKRAAGLTGVACFLVDRGVVGLKDAWFRLGIERSGFQEMLDRSVKTDIPMRRGSIEEVRRWVAGGLRWAHENGMRLPSDWQRVASLIGGVGDWTSADVSAFVKEFAGHPDDLRQRLIAEPFASYIQRPDVAFIFNADVTYMDQATGIYVNPGESLDDAEDDNEVPEEVLEAFEALGDRVLAAAEELASQTGQWLQRRREAPSAELAAAWKSLMAARVASKTAIPDDAQESDDLCFELLEECKLRIEEPRQGEFDRAVGQVLNHLETDPLLMQEAVMKHPWDAGAAG